MNWFTIVLASILVGMIQRKLLQRAYRAGQESAWREHKAWRDRIYLRIMEDIRKKDDWVEDLRSDHERHQRGMGVTKVERLEDIL